MRNFIILSLLLMMVSCYEKQEGCLDFRASNYDFGADKSCEDCCTYPSLKLRVTHVWGEDPLVQDSVYTSFSGQSIRILDAQFFISDIFLSNGSTQETILETEIVEDINGVETEILENYTFVQSTRFSYTIGTFDMADDYDGISFKVGIDGKFLSDKTDDYPTFFDELTYEYTNFRMRYVLEDVSADTLTFELKGPETSVALKLNANLEIPLGVEFTIPFFVNYNNLLRNIDLSNLNSVNERNQFMSNYFDAFSF